ncbi:TolC family protein [Pseudoduganella sp. RAF53_2]|uniref:TolC family protein n=1 Tax=unclassified Pseudoduganella TaxID=2637179 RepID=UPI003F98851C
MFLRTSLPILAGGLLALSFTMSAAAEALFCGGSHAPDGESISPDRPQTLPDLIAIGMKNNADTRTSWLQAEDASLNLGITRSKFGPMLAAEAVALHEHSAFPLPKNLDPKGYFKSNAEGFIPSVALKWLVYDSGGKEAAIEQASQALAGARFSFNATHRKVTIQIMRQFYHLSAVLARREAAEATLQNALMVEQVAQARRQRGLGTAPEALQAHAAVAEARLQVEDAITAVEDGRMALLEAMGLRPDTALCIQVPAGAPEPEGEQKIDKLVEQAISNRPEVQAAMAQVRAGEAAVNLAKSDYGPKVLLHAHVGENIGRTSSNGGPWSSVNQPIYGIGVIFQLPLYDGSMRKNNVALAHSKQEIAQARLDSVKNQVVHEVVKARLDLTLARRRVESTQDLLAAAQESFNSTLKSYKQGLSTMQELSAATASLARAQTSASQANTDQRTARAVLAFAAGDMLDVLP